MAVGAYASVLTLMRSLDNALLPSRCSILPNKSRIEALQENFSSLQESLELHSSLLTAKGEEVAPLDDPTIQLIRQLVVEADDVIDKFIVDRLRVGESDDDELDEIERSSFCRDVEAMIQRTESINLKLMAMITERDRRVAAVRPRTKSSYADAPSVDSSVGTNTVVGFEDHSEKIMAQLVGTKNPNLQIIPVVGMGGTGKTTLARHVFESKLVTEHFDVRIWLTISQEYDDVQEILLDLKRKKVIDGNDADLGTSLHKKLYGRRYLIVMDDVWSVDAWNGLKSFFPSNGNRSRIVITTRLSNVADSIAPNNCYSIGLLDEDKSWTLFREKSLCSAEFEEIGKKIAKKCGGLPLALVVVGVLLAKSNGGREYWELVAENMNSFLESEIEENCLSVLSVSYNHLPLPLKPCFLYMGVFPEDSDIEVNQLIESWVAEGIVRPEKGRNTEDIAMEYLEDLIGRNMVLVRRLGDLREIKICGIHDLLRQLCIKESQKERLLSVPTVQLIPFDIDDLQNPCFLCGEEGACKRIQLCSILVGSRSTTQTDPMVCDVCIAKYPRLNGSSRSVKLIDEINNRRADIPQLTKLRSLSIGDPGGVMLDNMVLASPFPLHVLWNLQVFYHSVYNEEDGELLLSKIWEMPQLRHVRTSDQLLPDPDVDANVLQHLQTLEGISGFRCTDEVVRRIPNLVILRVLYKEEQKDWSYYCLNNLALLRNLHSLYVDAFGSIPLDIKSISFPQSLKKLSLSDVGMSGKDMGMIGSLPNLEVLILSDTAFVDDEWCTVEGQFPKLKYLNILFSGLVIWRSESSHFRVLEKLALGFLEKLEEFPLDIGDINTLLRIRVDHCSECINDSVKQIAEEQENNGNDLLHIHIEGDEEEEEEGDEDEGDEEVEEEKGDEDQ